MKNYNYTKWMMLVVLSLATMLTACSKKTDDGGAVNTAFTNCANCGGIIGHQDQYIGSVKGTSPGNLEVRLDVYGDPARMYFGDPRAMTNYQGPVAVAAVVTSTGASSVYGGCNLHPGNTVMYSVSAGELRNGILYNVKLQGTMPNNVLANIRMDQGVFYTNSGNTPQRDTMPGSDYNTTQNRVFSSTFIVESISNMPCSGAYTVN